MAVCVYKYYLFVVVSKERFINARGFIQDMRIGVDLHVHSTGSDGVDTPRELMVKAKKAGVRFLSITDHDNIDYVAESQELARLHNLDFISGVELSIAYKHPLYENAKKSLELHLLGYGFNPENKQLIEELRKNKEHRQWRAEEIFKRVNKALVEDNIATISKKEFSQLEKQVEGAIGRPHIAQLLMEKGIVSNTQEAFDRYLIKCDVPKRELTLNRASKLIRNAGGFTVLAHPSAKSGYALTKISNDVSVHAGIIEDMEPNIDGIECYYWDHPVRLSRSYALIAKDLDLIVTGGSDHHGEKRGRERIGQLSIPVYVIEQKIFKW